MPSPGLGSSAPCGGPLPPLDAAAAAAALGGGAAGEPGVGRFEGHQVGGFEDDFEPPDGLPSSVG